MITGFLRRPGGEVQEASIEALIRDHLQDALAAGTEGLMLKALTGAAATYQPSKRSTHWLKIKRFVLSLILLPLLWHMSCPTLACIWRKLRPSLPSSGCIFGMRWILELGHFLSDSHCFWVQHSAAVPHRSQCVVHSVWSLCLLLVPEYTGYGTDKSR